MNTITRSALFVSKRVASAASRSAPLASANSHVTVRCLASLDDSIKRVAPSTTFPNEYPGQNYEFNWALNFDGVTPLKKSAFRICKPLDLKVAGLTPLKKTPLKVNAATARGLLPEAGSDSLSFEAFDKVSEQTRDLLSSSDTLYCPEGHVPGTRTGVRIISNSATLAPKLLAYLERAPKKDPDAMPITAYVLEDESMEQFAAYAIEEVEERFEDGVFKSVAAIVCIGKKVSVETVVAGLELSVGALQEDEEARKKEAEEAKEE